MVRMCAAVLAALVLAAVAEGQWLEDTISTGLRPDDVVWHARTGKVYVANAGDVDGPDSTVGVIDGATNQVIARVNVGLAPYSLAASSVDDRVYVWVLGDSTIKVIDCTLDSVVAVYPGVERSLELYHLSQENKLYSLNTATNTVSIFDCAGDSLLASIPVGDFPSVIAVNTRENKVYVGIYNDGEVAVIDGAGDSLLATIDSVNQPWYMEYDSLDNRLYVGADDAATMNLTTIDAGADTVDSVMSLNDAVQGMGYDPRQNRLWVELATDLRVFDCGVDSQVKRWSVACEQYSPLVYNPTTNRMFVPVLGDSGYPRAWAVDCSSFVRTAFIRLPAGPNKACCNPVDSRVYISAWVGRYVMVIRDSGVGGVAERLMGGVGPGVPVPTFVRGALALAGHDPADLLDATGRRAAVLLPGRNDVSGLSPGVYFVRRQGRRVPGVDGSCVRVVILR